MKTKTINNETATWETGAKSHEVNNLILIAENTESLYRICQGIYNDFMNDPAQRDYITFETKQTIYKTLRFNAFLYEVLAASGENYDLTIEQQRDFIECYMDNYRGWLKEQKNAPLVNADKLKEAAMVDKVNECKSVLELVTMQKTANPQLSAIIDRRLNELEKQSESEPIRLI